jgi:hypothetical protein
VSISTVEFAVKDLRPYSDKRYTEHRLVEHPEVVVAVLGEE